MKPGAFFGFAALTGLVLVSLPRGVCAAELRLEQTTRCTSEEELSFDVQRAVGEPLESVAPLQFSIRIDESPDGYVARLEATSDGERAVSGARSLRAPSCRELTEALVLAMAIAIGAERDRAEAAQAISAPEATPDLEGPPAPDPERPSERPPSGPGGAAGPAATLAGSAWLVADTGTLPRPGIGLSGGVSLGWPSFELRALGTVLPERRGTLVASDASSPGASIGLLAGSLLACVPIAVKQSALELALCAGGELGQLSGSGTGVSTPHDRRALWAAARLDLAARWVVGDTPLALDLLVTAAAPLSRDEFILKDLGSVHRPASVIGRAGVGLTLFVDR